MFRDPRVMMIAAALLSPVVIRGQDCPEFQPSNLGNTTAPSSVGLLADMLRVSAGDTDSNPSVQIREVNVVCLVQGTVRDTYRSVSLVVRYLRASDSMEVIAQMEYQCMSGVWEFQGSAVVTDDPLANFTTPVETDCILCIVQSAAPPLAVVTEVEHCLSK